MVAPAAEALVEAAVVGVGAVTAPIVTVAALGGGSRAGMASVVVARVILVGVVVLLGAGTGVGRLNGTRWRFVAPKVFCGRRAQSGGPPAIQPSAPQRWVLGALCRSSLAVWVVVGVRASWWAAAGGGGGGTINMHPSMPRWLHCPAAHTIHGCTTLLCYKRTRLVILVLCLCK